MKNKNIHRRLDAFRYALQRLIITSISNERTPNTLSTSSMLVLLLVIEFKTKNFVDALSQVLKLRISQNILLD